LTVRITPIWNSLPNWVPVVDVDNINTFKVRLDRCWSKPGFVWFTGDITVTGDRSQCDIDVM